MTLTGAPEIGRFMTNTFGWYGLLSVGLCALFFLVIAFDTQKEPEPAINIKNPAACSSRVRAAYAALFCAAKQPGTKKLAQTRRLHV